MSSTVHRNTPERSPERSVEEDLKTLKADFKTLREDLATLASAKANEAKSRLEEGSAELETEARRLAGAAEDELVEIQRQAERAVRRKPLTAVGAALAIGYFIGAIAGRR